MTREAPGAEDLDRLAQAFVDQARRGQSPSIESVASEHPALAEDIRELFPVLALVEGLKAEDDAPARRAPPLPDRIGDYALGAELGRGGMGTVLEGRRIGGGDGPARVAVKLVHAHLLGRPEYVARFLNEAAAGRQVVHENVVRTLDTGVVDVGREEVPYILLELIEGQNLRALLREVGVVPERLCRHVGIRLADALTAIHDAGLVHRDVKPENVVITTDETVKLMDLGVAVVQDRLHRLSHTGEFVGSILYAAPGQVAGEAPHPRWDLYALGILLYELATGQHPARSAGLSWLRADEPARRALTRHDELAGLSPFFAAVIESLLAGEEDGSLATAAAVREVLTEGDRSAWWRSRRDAAATPAARLRRLSRPTAFYGRKAEWRALDEALTAASEDHGRVVLVEGEAGIGKSRLLYEWAAALRGTLVAPHVILLQHAPGDAAGDEPQLAAALAEILGTEDLDARLARLLASRARLAPELARRLRGEAGPSQGAPHDAAWLGLLQALACQRPTLVVFEDLHFAAEEDMDRFLFFAGGASTPGLLLLGTFRPEPEPRGLRELGLRDHVIRLPLEGLDTQACHQLLLEASEDVPHLGESVQSLAERSDRNPMFLLELVRRARERVDAAVSGETTVPDSLRGFLAARIGALSPSDRELLETAACQGYEFDPVLVAQAAGARRIHALKRFARLEHGDHLLRASGRLYQFQHHLVQEVLYADLHPALRETYHAALGEALEAALDQPTETDAVALCIHFLKGSVPERARPHLRRALEHLDWERPAYVAAEELAEMALAVEGLLVDGDRAFALLVRGRACVGAARLDEAAEALEETLSLARAAGEGILEVEALRMLSWLSRRRDEPDGGARYLELAAARAHDLGEAGPEATAIARLAVLRTDHGRYDEAEALFRRAFDALGNEDDPHARSRLMCDLAVLRIHQGRLDEAQALFEECEQLTHAIGDVSTEFLTAQELGRLAFRRGRFEDAVRHARTALELGRRLGMHHRDAFLLLNMGRCLSMIGRYDEAYRHVTESLEIARREDTRVELAAAGLVLTGIHVARGALAAALDAATSARSIAAGLGRVDLPVQTAVTEASVLTLLGRFAEVERVVDAAAEGWNGLGPPSLGVGLTIARARLREAQGRHDAARALYDEAAAQAERGSLLGPPHAFYCARARLRAGQPEAAEEGLREALAWARENGVPSFAVLSQVHLAGRPGGDRLAARVALERHADRLTAAERVEAHLALWEADGEPASLEAARRALECLVQGAPPEDRDAMRTRVEPFRRVTSAGTPDRA